MVNNAGKLVSHYVYDAFGEVLSGDTTKTRYLYTGRELDAATGLQYNRHRWYDPFTGRWISEDPIGFEGGDYNLSRYVGNMATYATDPEGLSVLLPPDYITNMPEGPEKDEAKRRWRSKWEKFDPSDLVCPIGGVVSRMTIKEIVKRAKEASKCITEPAKELTERAINKAQSLMKGVPESRIGPSGKPKFHSVDHSSRKRALDAARNEGKGPPINNPRDKGQPPHFHSTDGNGAKYGHQSPHHNYPTSEL